MKKKKFIMLAIIGFLSITTLYAYQDECLPCPPPCCECPNPPPCCDIPEGPKMSAYNHPANIDFCGSWDAFATFTFLWVLPGMEQLEFAKTINLPNTFVGKFHEFNFAWKPAFKLGLGFNFAHDNWDVYLQYTRINTSMSNTVDRGPNIYLFVSALWQYDYSSLFQIKSEWDLDFNIFDLEFGRPYYNGKFLKFKAHYGLKGGWINHKNKEEGLYGTDIIKGNFYCKSWLIGPKAGIKTKWTLCDSFRFFGDTAASIFYQKFYKISYREPSITDPSLWFYSLDLVAKQLNASLESIIGIAWRTFFNRNNWYIDLALGYEFQLFLNQNKMAVLNQDVNSFLGVKAGNLMFHGLNVTMEFDF